MSIRSILGGAVLALSLTACSTPVGMVTSALSSAVAKPGVSASLQIGDKQTAVQGTTLGKSDSSTKQVQQKVVAKKAEIKSDESQQSKKTEIGAVTGNVSVQQGPSTSTLVMLAAGWPLFITFLIVILWRRVRGSTGTIA